MNIVNITNTTFSSNRTEIRKEIINLFLDEKPGTGKKHLTSRYKYITKNVGKHEIYLSRPAQFNNGFDFTLNVSGINFNNGYYNDKGKLKRATNRPSHGHILDDLKIKKKENPSLYKDLFIEIINIYNCQEPTNTVFNFSSGYKSEIILECIKWLFIEQDVTYWNYSARAMFFNSIKKI